MLTLYSAFTAKDDGTLLGRRRRGNKSEKKRKENRRARLPAKVPAERIAN